jgi:hypothetical protein
VKAIDLSRKVTAEPVLRVHLAMYWAAAIAAGLYKVIRLPPGEWRATVCSRNQKAFWHLTYKGGVKDEGSNSNDSLAIHSDQCICKDE